MGRYEGISVRDTKNSFKYLQSVYGDIVYVQLIITLKPGDQSHYQKISLREQKHSLYVCPLVLLC